MTLAAGGKGGGSNGVVLTATTAAGRVSVIEALVGCVDVVVSVALVVTTVGADFSIRTMLAHVADGASAGGRAARHGFGR